MSVKAKRKRGERAAWCLYGQGRGPHPGRLTNEQRALVRLEGKAKRTHLSPAQRSEMVRLRAKSAEAGAA